MKRAIISISIFIAVAMIYFAVATQFTFHPKWVLDYFNLLAQSLREGHINILNPSTTYDLIQYQGKWYAPWGILAALFFIPIQLVKGRFIPPLYISIFFASVNVVIFYWLLRRVREEFFPVMKIWSVWLVMVFYAFGTMNFYVGTLGSAWHVDQMVSSSFGSLSLYLIFKRRRTRRDYLWSVAALIPTFFGHATLTLLSSVPFMLYLWDLTQNHDVRTRLRMLYRGIVIFGVPLGIGTIGFFLYNYLRFGNIFEYGYRYIREAPQLAQMRITHGVMSLWHIPNNLWYFALNIPSLTWQHGPHLGINLYGNSLFFLSPPLLAIFWAVPIIYKSHKWKIDPYVASLWIGAVVTFLPSLMLYSTGWMQFGYRYALDIFPLLVLLTVFGMKGKLNILYIGGVVLAILFHIAGIQALM